MKIIPKFKGGNSSYRILQDRLYRLGYYGNMDYSKAVDGIKGPLTEGLLKVALGRNWKPIKRLSKAQYLYWRGTGYSSVPWEALAKYAIGTSGTVDFSDDDDLMRQYYAAYLVNNGRTALDDTTYEKGLKLKPITEYSTNDYLRSPLRMSFANAAKGFVNDNDTIKLYDRYDFHTDYLKINEQRKRKGLKPLSIGVPQAVETFYTRHPMSGYTSTLKLTPDKRKQFDKEYENYLTNTFD